MGRKLVRRQECQTRAQILAIMEEGPISAYQLSKIMGLNYCTIRYHLDVLTKEGAVVPIKRSNAVIYRKAKTLPSMGATIP
jgi:predicted ArsR family transcriptional regulator